MFHERVFSPRLHDYSSPYIFTKTLAVFVSTDYVRCSYILSLPLSSLVRQNSPTESFDKQVDRAVLVYFPGIPLGIDVNPLHGFALKRTTARPRPAIALLTRYMSSILPKTCQFPVAFALPSQCKRKERIREISPSHSISSFC